MSLFSILASVRKLHSPGTCTAHVYMILRAWRLPQAASAIASLVYLVSQLIYSTSGHATWNGVAVSVAHYTIRDLNCLLK